jgi:hypothetical protein
MAPAAVERPGARHRRTILRCEREATYPRPERRSHLWSFFGAPAGRRAPCPIRRSTSTATSAAGSTNWSETTSAASRTFWVALERTKDFAEAERLGLEFAEDFRLLRDIGWSEHDRDATAVVPHVHRGPGQPSVATRSIPLPPQARVRCLDPRQGQGSAGGLPAPRGGCGTSLLESSGSAVSVSPSGLDHRG